jgi:hypothetical protein
MFKYKQNFRTEVFSLGYVYITRERGKEGEETRASEERFCVYFMERERET